MSYSAIEKYLEQFLSALKSKITVSEKKREKD